MYRKSHWFLDEAYAPWWLVGKVKNSEREMKMMLGLVYESWHEQPSNGICPLPNITYSCHLTISQAGGKEADETKLSSHLGMLYLQWCSFLQGQRSTTSKWCVGVCSGPATVWVTGLAHLHQHDTAPKNRPARLPAEAGCADPKSSPCTRSIHVFSTRVGDLEVHVRRKGKTKMPCPVCNQVCIAALGYYLQESILFLLCVSTPPKAVC